MLCGLLVTEEGLTMDDLMARYGVSRRTIYTDFRVLRAAGFTLDCYETGRERRKVWRIVT
jgi:predicted DNA-binding transcriptional regulator YafY